jgi:hypothetical protein
MTTPPQQLDTAKTRPRTAFLLVSACYSILIVAAVLVISSLINNGQGILGLSLELSLGIIGSIGAAALLALPRTIWREVTLSNTPREVGSETLASRRKCELEFDEWFAILTEAKREFYVAGHSMGKWCDESRRQLFIDELRRILGARGKVTLVMLGPNSPQLPTLKSATGRDYSARIAHSIPILREFEQSLVEDHSERFQLKTLEDDGPIPYMVVGNEQRLITATYLARTDSDDMPCLELKLESESARAIYDDFHKLAEV